jgi:ABC-type Na+ efflux pump permease subunit
MNSDFVFFLTVGLVVVLLWAFLNWRETKRADAGLPRHSGLRLVFASIAILTVLFSGGCGAYIFSDMVSRGTYNDQYVSWQLVATLSLPPVIVGIIIWWLAMRRKSG